LTATIETARLLLHVPVVDDLDHWAALGADPEATRFLGGTWSRSIAWRLLCTNAGSWSLFGFGQFSVVEKVTGRWIGRVGLWQPEGWPGPEVGWALLSEAWGQGYATEAAEAAMDFAVETLGWPEVIHCINPANAASIRLAERLGSRYAGTATLPEPLFEEVGVWRQTRDEWRARARP
jgi:RimJ/RimL family protein N-acetyltransferase